MIQEFKKCFCMLSGIGRDSWVVLCRTRSWTWWSLWVPSNPEYSMTLNSLKSIWNLILAGCCWNACKLDSVPKEKSLKTCKPVSKWCSAGQGLLLNTKDFFCMGPQTLGLPLWHSPQMCEQLFTKVLSHKPLLDHFSWLQGHKLPAQIHEQSVSAV